MKEQFNLGGSRDLILSLNTELATPSSLIDVLQREYLKPNWQYAGRGRKVLKDRDYNVGKNESLIVAFMNPANQQGGTNQEVMGIHMWFDVSDSTSIRYPDIDPGGTVFQEEVVDYTVSYLQEQWRNLRITDSILQLSDEIGFVPKGMRGAFRTLPHSPKDREL